MPAPARGLLSRRACTHVHTIVINVNKYDDKCDGDDLPGFLSLDLGLLLVLHPTSF